MGTVLSWLVDLAVMVSSASAGSPWRSLQWIRARLVALFRDWVADLNIPLLKYYSLLIEAELRGAGRQLLSEYLTGVLLAILLAAGIPALWVAWRLLGSGLRIHKAAYRKIAGDAGRFGASLRAAAGSYFRFVVDLAFEGLLLVCAATLLTIVTYGLCKLSWYAYLVTPVGRLYPLYFPERAQIMNAVLGQDLFLMPMVSIGIALFMGLLAGTVCRLLHITRIVYGSRGLAGRIALFGLPLTAAVAVFTQAVFAIPHWGAAYAAALLPTLLVFSFCFKTAHGLLPEIGMVAALWKRERPTPAQVLFLQNRNTGRRILEFDPLQSRLTGRRFPADDDIAMQGQFLARSGHQYILYRYGHDLFFLVDDLELQLSKEMSARLAPWGRFGYRFELIGGETCLFRLFWSALPGIGPGKATMAFFEALQATLKDRAAYEDAYTAQWDWEAA